MEFNEKVKKIKYDLEQMNLDSSLLLLNINIDVFLNECRELAYYVKKENIQNVFDFRYKEKLEDVVKRYKGSVLGVDTQKIKNIIQKVFYIYGYILGVPFCLKKSIDEEYKNQVYQEVIKMIKDRYIVISDETLRVKSYGIQFIKYIHKTKYSFDRLFDMIQKQKELLLEKKDVYYDLQMLKITSLFSFDKNSIENEWFVLSNYFSEFYHNLIISLELYLKSILVEVCLYKKSLSSVEILKEIEEFKHSYSDILNKLISEKIITYDSSSVVNNDYINKQITKLKNNFSHLLLEFDNNCVLEQIRYAELSNYYEDSSKLKKKSIKNSSPLYTSNIIEIIKLFDFLYNCFEEILTYRSNLHISICESIGPIKDSVVLTKYDKDGNIIDVFRA